MKLQELAVKNYGDMPVMNCVSAPQREMNMREKLHNIFEMVTECEGLTDCIDGRLLEPRPENPCCGVNQSCETVEEKIQIIYNHICNLCDHLRYINDKL